LSSHINGEVYRQFLQDKFPALSYDVPLGLRVIMWFMHDVAAHCTLIVRKLLREIFIEFSGLDLKLQCLGWLDSRP
jgi:hypothetical protein